MPKKVIRRVIAGYVPVIHRGYLQFFNTYSGAEAAYVFGQDLLEAVDYLQKDLRALSPGEQVKVIQGLQHFKSVEILSEENLSDVDSTEIEIIMPDEDISREVAKRFKAAKLEFYPVFLRWDRNSADANQPDPDEKTVIDPSAVERLVSAQKEAQTSSDIWRHVGAIIVDAKGEEIGRAANRGEPTAHSPWMEGDPRNIFKRGTAIEISLFTHAEARLIAEAARDGTSLRGASLYVTTFPCPSCAKLIAHSGIKACYYTEGYAVLDGKRVMEAYGVDVARVITESAQIRDKAERLVPYAKSKNKD